MHRRTARSIAFTFVSLTFWSGFSPLWLTLVATPVAAQETSEDPTLPARQIPDGERGNFEEPRPAGTVPAVEERPSEQMRRSADTLGQAITDRQRLKLNGIDGQQLKALAALAEQIALNPELGRQYSEGNLPPELAESVDLDRLSTINPDVVRSLIYLVTPTGQQDGAGQEFLDVVSITKGHRTNARKDSDETEPPEGEDPKISPHFYERGSAVDVGQIDYLRGSEFTIEVDSDGKQTVKDEVKRLPLKPIEVAWQADPPQAGTRGGAAPNLNGGTVGTTGNGGVLGFLVEGLMKGFDRAAADIDLATLQGYLSSFQNLGDLARQLGEGYLGQVLETDRLLATGPHALRVTGQRALEQATGGQIPGYGFFGNDADELTYNVGREAVTRTLGMGAGALIGRTSADVITNAGERFWELALGDLPLGTLDGLENGNRADLERRLGRGRVAKLLGVEVGSLPLGASPADFQKALGLNWSDLEANSQLASNQLGIPDLDSANLVRSNPDEWLRAIGAVVLETPATYHPTQRDAAYNLEERPALVELPSGTPAERAQALRDQYRFKSAAEAQIDQVAAGSDDELRAWLLVNAYDRSSDPNRTQLTDRLLAADRGVFYDTGIETIAKGLAVDNTVRASLRAYLRNGTAVEDSGTDLTFVAQSAGFPTREAFDSVFRDNAPAVGFTHVGRITLARVFSTSPDEVAALSTPPVLPSADELKNRLEQVRSALGTARADTSIRGATDPALGAVDQLLSNTTDAELATGQIPSSWRPLLAQISQAAQAAVNSPRSGLSGARELLVATQGLFAPTGDAIYERETVDLAVPGQSVGALFGEVLRSKTAMTTVVEQIGGWTYDDSLELDHGTTYALHESVQRNLARGNAAAAQNTIERFASVNEQSLRSVTGAANGLVRQFATPLNLDPTRLTRSIFAGWQLTTDLGSRIIDAGFGLSRSRSFGEILRTTPFNGAANAAFFESIGLRSLTQTLTGLADVIVDPDDVGGQFPALVYSYVSAETGWQIGPDGVIIGDPQQFIQSITGKPLTPALATALGIIDTSPQGLRNFASTWRFWENPQFAPRLEAIVGRSFAGQQLPPGLLSTLFDPGLGGAERTKQLQGLFRTQLQNRLVDEVFNEQLNIPGLPAGALAGAANILLSDATPAEKSAALQSLGITTADAVTQAQFGFPVSWLVDKQTSTNQKVELGLRIASNTLGLDPSISSAVEQTWRTFFIDGGIDTSTPAGRAQLAGLVTSVGTAAGVPSEYAALAAGFVTGDVEATALAYAGGAFSRALGEAGIYSVGFGDVYAAFAGPNKNTLERFRAEAEAAVTAKFGDAQLTGEREAYFDTLMQEKVSRFRATAQENLMFAGVDLAFNKSLGISGVSGMAKAFMRGTTADQVGAVGQLLSSVTNSPEAAIILGNTQLVTDLGKFFGSGNIADISDTSFASLDGWLAQGAGVPIPPGTSKAMLDFTRTGDFGSFENLVSADTVVAFGGGYLDQAMGMPVGATAAMYNAYKGVEAASANLAQLENFVGPLQPGQLDAARAQLGAANAALVGIGVNLLFGESFANLDKSFGLPSGTVSMLVSTGIYAAMVPGVALGQLMMATVVPWMAPLLLAGVLGVDIGSLLGGLIPGFGGKKEVKVILWSRYTELWPEEVDYACEVDPETKKPVMVTENGETKPKCKQGKEIALEQELPDGVFHGDTPQQFEEGAREAANGKITQLISNLLLMPARVEDTQLELGQIRSHQKRHGELLEPLMDRAWGDGSIGSYHDSVTSPSFPSRRGYLYDEPGKRPYFHAFVHWNF